jgi:hypothetical protein
MVSDQGHCSSSSFALAVGSQLGQNENKLLRNILLSYSATTI